MPGMQRVELLPSMWNTGMRFFRFLPIFRHFVVRKRTREKHVNPGEIFKGGRMGVCMKKILSLGRKH